MKPLCVDLYCGLGGWAEGFLAEGYDVIGYDIERHDYGTGGYPGELRIKNVLDITTEEIRALNPRVIVASPPCQEPSYRAMPWSRAKALNVRPPTNFLCLFYACFKLAQDVGVPVIVENVVGAQRWVGSSAWNFGSYYLWGDVPALMPTTLARKAAGQNWNRFRENGEVSPHWILQGVKQSGISGTRKAASAMIAKIPFPLASHIARCFKVAA